MEKEAHERDQIYWACSAQNEKLLPKAKAKGKKSGSEQLKKSVAPYFEAHKRMQGQHPL